MYLCPCILLNGLYTVKCCYGEEKKNCEKRNSPRKYTPMIITILMYMNIFSTCDKAAQQHERNRETAKKIRKKILKYLY